MSIIDFSVSYPKVTKSWDQIQRELYEQNKNMLPFNIGDSVKLNMNNNEVQSVFGDFTDKTYTIVDTCFTLDNRWFYKLDIDNTIKAFTCEHLVKIK